MKLVLLVLVCTVDGSQRYKDSKFIGKISRKHALAINKQVFFIIC